MESQWDNTPAVTVSSLDEKREMWQNISARIHLSKRNGKAGWLNTYGTVASILLIIAIGASFSRQGELKESHIYILCTGNQDKNILTLNDGSRVKIGAGSKLTYPEKFSSKIRLVQLEGQAFFDIAKDTGKPFSVEIGDITITALGTSFEVFHDKHNNTVETILLSGKVKVENKNANSGKTEYGILYPDQKLTVSLNTGKMEVTAVNADNYSGWRNFNGLSFTNEKLSIIIPRLEYWYGCRIEYDPAGIHIQDERFSFKVKDEPLDRSAL